MGLPARMRHALIVFGCAFLHCGSGYTPSIRSGNRYALFILSPRLGKGTEYIFGLHRRQPAVAPMSHTYNVNAVALTQASHVFVCSAGFVRENVFRLDRI